MLIFPPYLSPSFKINSSYFISIGPGICYSVLSYPVVRICAFVAFPAETARKKLGFISGERNPKSPCTWHCAGLIPAPGTTQNKRLLKTKGLTSLSKANKKL
jgi:hypothetical protein